MNGNTTYRRGIVVVMGLVMGLMVSCVAASAAPLPPGSQVAGKSFAQWTAEWWKWAFAIPGPANPQADPSGARVHIGQSGPVWFLPSYGPGPAFPRTTVRSSVYILLPILNVECSTVEAPPFFGANYAELKACANLLVNEITGLSVAIDGVPLANPASYREESPLFTFTFPRNNFLGVPGPGSALSVSDGFWIFLPPLSVGDHTVHVAGSFGPTLGNFPINTTWTLHVVP